MAKDLQLNLFENTIIKPLQPQKNNFLISQNSQNEVIEKKQKQSIKYLTQLRDKFFYETLENNYKNFGGDIDRAEKMTFLDSVVIKPNSIINYSLPYKRNYNKNSLGNLLNVEKKETTNELKKLKEKKKIKNVNKWADKYLNHYETKNNKKYTGTLSKTTTNKIRKITHCFVRSIFSKYISTEGFNQRTLTFCTFTLSENQKHSDDFITKNFIDFLDHLKKVKNFIIDPVTKLETKNEGLKLQNYVWRSETQENGNIHFHLIADTFLNQNMLRRVWNNYLKKMGYKFSYSASNVQSLKKDKKSNKIKNVENYLTKYLTKQPLKNKYKYFTKNELKDIPETEKFRRPVIGKSWGCSKNLLSLEYPTFYNSEAKSVLKNITNKMRKLISETLPEYISVFLGNTKEVLKKCEYNLQNAVKAHFQVCYNHLYATKKFTLNI